MKRSALVVVALYAVALAALTAPLGIAAFWPQVGASEVRDVMGAWQYWMLVAVLVLGQAALLVVPVKAAGGRPTTRRSLLWPVLASGFLMGLLAIGAVASVGEFIKQSKVTDSNVVDYVACAAGAAIWLVWGLVFYRSTQSANARDFVTRQCRLLLRGSLLELLVAVPTHIVARNRDYCCAGVYTFVGISFGLTVMLASFGPAVFFLFAERWRRVHPPTDGTPKA